MKSYPGNDGAKWYWKNLIRDIAVFFGMVLAVVLFIYSYGESWEQNNRRVHPDEVEIRDWIYSVGGSMQSHFDSERHITKVFLNKANITDDDLIRLTTLSHLEELDLSNTDITDEGISTILSMKSLRYLTIKDTRITYEGLRRFIKERADIGVDTTFRKPPPDEIDVPSTAR